MKCGELADRSVDLRQYQGVERGVSVFKHIFVNGDDKFLLSMAELDSMNAGSPLKLNLNGHLDAPGAREVLDVPLKARARGCAACQNIVDCRNRRLLICQEAMLGSAVRTVCTIPYKTPPYKENSRQTKAARGDGLPKQFLQPTEQNYGFDPPEECDVNQCTTVSSPVRISASTPRVMNSDTTNPRPLRTRR